MFVCPSGFLKSSKNNQIFKINVQLTRMTTFIKVKLKKSNKQTNIDKYRMAVTKYYRITL